MTKKGIPSLNSRLPNGIAGRNKAYFRYRDNAKARNIEFLLLVDDAEILFKSNCYYCGKEPEMIDRGTKDKTDGYSVFIHNGIDRVDNDLGYTLENCVPCCKKCNNKKQGVTMNIARKMVEFYDRKAKVYGT